MNKNQSITLLLILTFFLLICMEFSRADQWEPFDKDVKRNYFYKGCVYSNLTFLNEAKKTENFTQKEVQQILKSIHINCMNLTKEFQSKGGGLI